jgi:predicted dehydrogenase
VNTTENKGLSRRDVIKTAGVIAAASSLAGVAIPFVHGAGDDTIKMALVGCGGRGTGAIGDAMNAKGGPVKLVAMADAFKDKLDSSHKTLQSDGNIAKQMDVPDDRKFVGFDAYKHAMDCLKPGDIVVLTTPLAFRCPQFAYAIEKGLNVFMEKPITADGPTTKKMFKLGEESVKKNLKVGVGLMCRHCIVRGELFKRIQDGAIGDITLLRAYREKGPEANCFTPRVPKGMNELEFQIRYFHGYLWASGGCYSDFLIHNIDECCWMKNAWPVMAQATGGRQYHEMNGVEMVDQNFDHYAVEYTFADGTKLLLQGRTMDGCDPQEFASFATGTKGAAVISQSSHTPARSRIQTSFDLTKKQGVTWHGPKDEPNPYGLEWNDLLEAIRADKPYNEVKRGAEASLVGSMGRMAAHTGRLVKWDDILNCEHEFAPNVDKFVIGGPAPLQADKDGRYPVPQPGKVTKQEYEDVALRSTGAQRGPQSSTVTK